MPTTTHRPQVLVSEGSRISPSIDQPVVRLATSPRFLSREDAITVRDDATIETMPREPRVVIVPPASRPQDTATERFTLLQKWDGVVLEADAETFTARLLDSNGELLPQQAMFSRSELSPEEETQIAVGASFVWTIGYRHKPSRERISYLYFRRLPPWSEDEIKAARSRAENVSTTIGWK